MKKYLWIVVLVVVIGIGGYLFGRGRAVGPEEVFINRFTLIENAVVLKGGFSSNGLYFSGYDSHVEGDSLYVKIRGSHLGLLGGDDHFDLKVKCDLKKVKKVYLTNGKSTKKALVWAQ